MVSPMECVVTSPCGRYTVHFSCDGRFSLHLDVSSNASRVDTQPAEVGTITTSSPSQTIHMTTTLDEQRVLQLSSAAGVRKSFAAFAEMMYNALIGRVSCVRFFIETIDELRRRIADDDRGGRRVVHEAAPDTTPAELAALDLCHDEPAAGTDAEVQRGTARLFFTVDYDVDFTRALFPIPLQPTPEVPDGTSVTRRAEAGGVPRRARPPLSTWSAAEQDGLAATSTAGQQSAMLQQALAEVTQLRTQNAQLRRENDALSRLSREKMLEMQRVCADFESHMQNAHEVNRLRARNTELRVRLQEAEEACAAAQRALAVERQARRAMTSLSRRAGSNDTGRAARSARSRGSRFDTPPPHTTRAACRTNSTASSAARLWSVGRRGGSTARGDNGGDSPAPRGRTGARPASLSRSRVSVAPISSRGSSPGSSCMSHRSDSHERLYRTQTACSQRRQVCNGQWPGLRNSPARAVFH